MATTLLFLPTSFRMAFAMVSAAPVFSRMVPMMVPQRITMPMLVIMSPKPLLTLFTTLAGVSSDSGYTAPQIRPTRSAMTVITMKGWIFHFEMAMTISPTDAMMSANRKKVCMNVSSF